MKLYYTTSVKEGNPQPKPEISLGGYASGTVVPNGRLDNLFSEISEYTIDKNLPEHIGLMLKNDTGVTVTDVKLHFVYDADASVKYEVAAVALSPTCYMEQLSDINSQPYSGTFYEADGELNAVTLVASLDATKKIGLWIKRTLLIDAINTQKGCDGLYSVFTQATPALSTTENVGIAISYEIPN